MQLGLRSFLVEPPRKEEAAHTLTVRPHPTGTLTLQFDLGFFRDHKSI